MWKKIAPLLVVFSVALNLAFLGLWGVRVAAPLWAADVHHDGEVWCPLHRRLNVTAEQWQRIEPRLAEFQRQSQAICEEMNRLRGELIEVIAGQQPDPLVIAARQEAIRAGQHRMQGLVVEHLLTEKEMLTMEQQRELFDLIRRRSGCMGPARMRGDAEAPSREVP